MENMRFYNESILKQMNNKEGCWKNCITQNDSKKSKTDNYVLYATGNSHLNGRKYVALPVETIIDDSIKKKYNLM